MPCQQTELLEQVVKSLFAQSETLTGEVAVPQCFLTDPKLCCKIRKRRKHETGPSEKYVYMTHENKAFDENN